jgi:hypothetical protein
MTVVVYLRSSSIYYDKKTGRFGKRTLGLTDVNIIVKIKDASA